MRRNLGGPYTALATITLTFLTVIPLAIIFVYSFMTKSINGGVIFKFSLEAYRTLFQPEYAKVLSNTLIITFWATLIALVVALPCAYYMALSRHKNLLLVLVIIPFWTNFLVRIFAWKAILEANGFLNLILMRLNIIDEPIIFLYNRYAVIIVLAYTYLPFAILPLYSAIDKFDFNLIEAARDLGCSHFRSLYRILLPNIRGGFLAALVFVTIPIFGQYVVPDLIGGGRGDTFMMGQKIANVFFRERNWPVPAAFTALLVFMTLCVFYLASLRRNRQLVKGVK